jgi:hypothetical protein
MCCRRHVLSFCFAALFNRDRELNPKPLTNIKPKPLTNINPKPLTNMRCRYLDALEIAQAAEHSAVAGMCELYVGLRGGVDVACFAQC